MGKVKTVVIGDEIAEEEAKKKAAVKREQRAKRALSEAEGKKAQKEATKHKEDTNPSATVEEVAIHPIIDDGGLENDKDTSAKKKKGKKVSLNDQYHFETGKKAVASQAQVDKSKLYSVKDALELVKKTSYSKFDGSVELHLNVSDKGLRGTTSLPHGTGKQIKVAIATDDLINSISSGSSINFDILVAEPSMMPKLAKVAKILGPRGLMPNPKTGTIGADPEKLAKELANGQVQWKTQNDLPIIHTVIGKVSFDTKKLEENYQALVKSIGKEKIKSAFVKATMGPSIKITQ